MVTFSRFRISLHWSVFQTFCSYIWFSVSCLDFAFPYKYNLLKGKLEKWQGSSSHCSYIWVSCLLFKVIFNLYTHIKSWWCIGSFHFHSFQIRFEYLSPECTFKCFQHSILKAQECFWVIFLLMRQSFFSMRWLGLCWDPFLEGENHWRHIHSWKGLWNLLG